MSKTNKNWDLWYKFSRYFLIFSVVLLYGLSLMMNYQANKEFDTLFIYETENIGSYKGFNFTEEARAEPVLFWRWSCDITRSQDYYKCEHCPLIFGECSQHTFELYELPKDELVKKVAYRKSRNFIQKAIMVDSLILILLALALWYYDYKTNRENWEKTPLAGLIKKIKEADKDGSKKKR